MKKMSRQVNDCQKALEFLEAKLDKHLTDPVLKRDYDTIAAIRGALREKRLELDKLRKKSNAASWSATPPPRPRKKKK